MTHVSAHARKRRRSPAIQLEGHSFDAPGQYYTTIDGDER